MTNQNQRSGEHGFRIIGNLVPTPESLRKSEATLKRNSKPLRKASAPTTEASRKAPARTGKQVSACGYSTILPSTDPLKLAQLSTAKLFRGIEALLPPRLDLRPVWRPLQTSDSPMSYQATGTAADKAKAKSLIQSTMTTLPVKAICKELATLNVLTRRREGSMADTELLIASYAEKLAPYPGEAVIWACRKWPEWSEAGKWWPAWAELHDMLEGRVAERRLMLEALG